MTPEQVSEYRRQLKDRCERAKAERDRMPHGVDHFWRGYVAGLLYALDAMPVLDPGSLGSLAAGLELGAPLDELDAAGDPPHSAAGGSVRA